MRIDGRLLLNDTIGLTWEFDTTLPAQFKRVMNDSRRVPRFERSEFVDSSCWSMDWLWFSVQAHATKRSADG